MNNIVEFPATGTSQYLGESLLSRAQDSDTDNLIEWNLALKVEIGEAEPYVLLSEEEQMSLHRAHMASVRFIDL